MKDSMKKFVLCQWVLLVAILPAAAADISQVRYHYDTLGRIHQTDYPSGTSVQHSYNAIDAGITTRYGSETIVSDTAYDDGGRPVRRSYASYQGAGLASLQRTYDGLGRPQSRTVTVNGQIQYRYWNAAFNPRGLISGAIRNDPGYSAVMSYAYDGRGQLTDVHYGNEQLSFAYDELGNLLEKSGIDSSQHDLYMPSVQQHFSAGNPFHRDDWRYDDAGRLVRDDQYTYEHNPAGLLVAIKERGTRKLIAHYLYNTNGERVRVVDETGVSYYHRDTTGKVISVRRVDTVGAVSGQEYVHHNGDHVFTAYYDDGAQQIDADLHASDYFGNAAIRWKHGRVDRFEYSPFGQQIHTGSVDHEGPFGFSGHEDDASGIIYMVNRYQDPVSARFLTPDPGRDFDPFVPSSYNLYVYAHNSPLNFIDPNGLADEFTFSITSKISVGGSILEVTRLYSMERYATAIRIRLAAGLTISGSGDLPVSANLEVRHRSDWSVDSFQIGGGAGTKSVGVEVSTQFSMEDLSSSNGVVGVDNVQIGPEKITFNTTTGESRTIVIGTGSNSLGGDYGAAITFNIADTQLRGKDAAAFRTSTMLVDGTYGDFLATSAAYGLYSKGTQIAKSIHDTARTAGTVIDRAYQIHRGVQDLRRRFARKNFGF
ncbi:RHS repeat-associated core domain-containing protein [Sulfidibacter corallicola]|uniref:RHS repeat-associated core domain-containing protein n=1 Tax=Sulfidibacter corallicola TaxID=2818388 RepID=A0A8A4TTN2_SULCO|nr:RHS repeat-associated core domain-containing protein [Sulfidibacter corallicola]QTD49895.1 RHS repeat-associated core domain-containing protein [Sulfidibacter corallicola]